MKILKKMKNVKKILNLIDKKIIKDFEQNKKSKINITISNKRFTN